MADFLTPKEVAEMLSVTQKTVIRWCTDGSLAHYKVGSRYRMTRENVEEFIQKIEKKEGK